MHSWSRWEVVKVWSMVVIVGRSVGNEPGTWGRLPKTKPNWDWKHKQWNILTYSRYFKFTQNLSVPISQLPTSAFSYSSSQRCYSSDEPFRFSHTLKHICSQNWSAWDQSDILSSMACWTRIMSLIGSSSSHTQPSTSPINLLTSKIDTQHLILLRMLV